MSSGRSKADQVTFETLQSLFYLQNQLRVRHLRKQRGVPVFWLGWRLLVAFSELELGFLREEKLFFVTIGETVLELFDPIDP